MNLYEAFKTSEDKEAKAGIVLVYGTAKIRILRAGGTNQKYYEAIRKHHSEDGEQVRLTPNDQGAILRMAKTYADSIIVGWEGVTDESGKPLEFNRENIIKLLTDLPELFADIREASANMALFREQYKAQLLGKSDNTSTGN